MKFTLFDTSLMVVLAVAAVVTLAIILYYYDTVAEARDKRMKWLLRKRLTRHSTAGQASWRRKFHSYKRDMFVAFAVSILAILICSILGMRLSIALVTSPVVFILSIFGLSHLQKIRERRQFEAVFPEAVEMLTRSIKTGVPLDEAFLSLAERFEGELAKRFEVFQSELALGQSFRDAGISFCRGLNMPDVEFFFAVLSLNRESGSELTPTLEAMSYTLRERQKVRRRAVVLTSEIRSSAKVMAALPFVLGAVMFFLQPGLVNFYLNDLTGQVILGVCLLSIVFGLLIIRDIANISD